ncbi:tryptophan 7-halogenase [Sneathiella limimaris]|uniref:tryptophan 7-halogenase n=1 Tax=Sneathiella limimaris TaxID=1964213 RepID=UPI00146E083D
MSEPITEITIVGGGTAGWLTAAFLVRYMNANKKESPTKITLIESPNVPTIGVGEATVPSMSDLLRSLAISEREFFRRCNASFKLGVRFVNWSHDHKGNATSFIHPFDGNSAQLGGQNPAYHFHKFGGPNGKRNIDDVLSASVGAIRAKRGPKTLDQGDYEKTLNYAYHLDAGKFAEFLRDISIERGVNHVLDDVEAVNLDEKGFVSSLTLQRNGEHPIQLVVDCTGFKGVIINEALGVKRQDYSKYLLNNRALAVQIPHEDVTQIEPCTTSTALGAGWVWNVPLFNRVGTGYVFSSDFRSDDEAIAEFLAHLGPRGEGAEPRAIPVHIGGMEKTWEKNCIAIGLSAGFIEPLESTAIYMIENSIKMLLLNFPDMSFPASLARRFNETTDRMMESIRDFIVLHYCINNRQDSEYWRVAREEMEIPDSLAEMLDEYQHTLPLTTPFDRTFLFNRMSFETVLFAKDYFKDTTFPAERFIRKEDWVKRVTQMKNREKALIKKLPGHYELLTAFRGEGTAKPAAAPNPYGNLAAAYSSKATVGVPMGGQPTVMFGGQSAKPNISFKPKEKSKSDFSEPSIL